MTQVFLIVLYVILSLIALYAVFTGLLLAAGFIREVFKQWNKH